MNVARVSDLVRDGTLFVEDGNHGEQRPLQHEFCRVGVPFVRPPDLIDGHVRFDQCDKINDDARRRIRKGIGRGGDILFTHRATVGRLAITAREDSEFVTNPGVTIWRCLDEEIIDRRYLYYWMHTPKFMDQVWSVAGGADTFPYVSLTEQRKLLIYFPCIEYQREIGSVLESIDQLIYLNNLTSETLETMIQAIFRDWFVDFGPVRRKMAGKTGPVELLGGLIHDSTGAAAMVTEFPDGLDYGEVPSGWVQRPLDQIAHYLNGLALQKFPPIQNEASLPVIKIAQLRNGLSETMDRASGAIPARYIVHDGDYLFSWSGSLMAKVWTEGDGALNQHLFKVTSTTYPQWFYALWVQHHLPDFQAIAASKATTMGHIQRGHLASAMAVCPPVKTVERMSAIMAPLWSRAIQSKFENRTLAEARDYLLPRLMSGELKVSDGPGHRR